MIAVICLDLVLQTAETVDAMAGAAKLATRTNAVIDARWTPCSRSGGRTGPRSPWGRGLPEAVVCRCGLFVGFGGTCLSCFIFVSTAKLVHQRPGSSSRGRDGERAV